MRTFEARWIMFNLLKYRYCITENDIHLVAVDLAKQEVFDDIYFEMHRDVVEGCLQEHGSMIEIKQLEDGSRAIYRKRF